MTLIFGEGAEHVLEALVRFGSIDGPADGLLTSILNLVTRRALEGDATRRLDPVAAGLRA